MKKATLGLIASCVFSALIYAGPEPSGKDMKQVAPMPAACPNWTGFYAGGFVGYKYGVIDSGLDLSGTWDLFTSTVPVVEDRSRQDLSTSGAELGGLIGYNYQWNKWVFGMEVAGGYLWLRDSASTGEFSSINSNFDLSTSFKTHYLLAAGPRVGYAFCRWLPYVTGGVAMGDLDLSQRFFSSDFFGQLHESGSETNAGWFLGGGLEYALTDHWRVRGQYEYVDLGDTRFTYDTINNSYVTQREVSLREHNVSFAIIYGF